VQVQFLHDVRRWSCTVYRLMLNSRATSSLLSPPPATAVVPALARSTASGKTWAAHAALPHLLYHLRKKHAPLSTSLMASLSISMDWRFLST